MLIKEGCTKMQKTKFKTTEDLKEEFFTVMTGYYEAGARRSLLEKELKKSINKEEEALKRYNSLLATIEKHFKGFNEDDHSR